MRYKAKQGFAGLLSIVMILSMLSVTAMAESVIPTEGTEAGLDGQTGADVPMPIDKDTYWHILTLISNLPKPEEITWRNKDDVWAKINEINRAMTGSLTDEEWNNLNGGGFMEKFNAVKEALNNNDFTPFFKGSGGAGTEDDPYKIASKEDLEEFRDYINISGDRDGCYLMTENIDLGGEGWGPIGSNPETAFAGTFDGGEHTVSNFSTGSLYGGLFGCVGSGGAVKNLTVDGTMNGVNYGGGIVGKNYGTIENCHNKGSFNGNIIQAGGIVGWNIGTVRNCTNSGNFDVSCSSVGGIVGMIGEAGKPASTIEYCKNTGTIRGSAAAGGIVGQNLDGSTIKSCNNYGPVTCTGPRFAGGIVAYSHSGAVEDCSNRGSITGVQNVGGIIGFSSSAIKNCWNTADVTGSNWYVGGIVGWDDRTIEICWNTGCVTGLDYVGGIAGADGHINNCWNTGNITCTGTESEYMGGITSINNNRNNYTSNSWNTGSIISDSPVRFMGHVVGISLYTIGKNCYYLDTCGGRNTDGVGLDETPKTVEDFASGEVTWLLQSGQDTEGLIWGQALGKDSLPVLTGDASKRVCQVTFWTSDGPAYAVEYVNAGHTVTLPEKPKRAGYAFYGWSTAQGAEGVPFTDKTPVEEDMTVYAVGWEPVSGDGDVIKIGAVHGIEKTEDLSTYIRYESGASTAGKFNYILAEGNDALNASVDGDTLTIPKEADAGTYTLMMTVEDKLAKNPLMQGANPAELTIRVTVAPAELELSVPEIPAFSYGKTLTDDMLTGCTAKIKGTETEVMGTWAWAVQGIVPALPDSGTTLYKVIFTPNPDKKENFTEASRSTEITVTVGKVPASGTIEGRSGLVYTGKAQELGAVAEEAAGGRFLFSAEREGEYSPDMPTGTDAGEYAFWYKVAGDENHTDTEAGQIAVTIAKADGAGALTIEDYVCMEAVMPKASSDTNPGVSLTYAQKGTDAFLRIDGLRRPASIP